jgi:hypothetical protein
MGVCTASAICSSPLCMASMITRVCCRLMRRPEPPQQPPTQPATAKEQAADQQLVAPRSRCFVRVSLMQVVKVQICVTSCCMQAPPVSDKLCMSLRVGRLCRKQLHLGHVGGSHHYAMCHPLSPACTCVDQPCLCVVLPQLVSKQGSIANGVPAEAPAHTTDMVCI